jgi:hypothetical protein
VTRKTVVSILIAIAAAARAISLAWLHPLNWDEIEYRRATAWVWHGLVPYRDFWEHHTPLQWFIFAPVAALAHGPGVSAIVALRFAQTIVWAIAFVLLNAWMRDAGIGRFARAAAILIALCSSMFMLAAVEYRVDALACALLVTAILLAQRNRLFWSGVALFLAGMANLRLGPLLVVALIAFAIQRRDRILQLAGGVAAALALSAAYFAITGTVAIAWQRLIVDNYLADHFARRVPGIFVHRMSMPFGATLNGFALSAIDPATIVLLVIGLIGMVHAFIRRQPQFIVIAAIQIANIVFVAMMKFVQTYHFETFFILLIPFVAMEIDRLQPGNAIVSALTLLVAFSVAVSVFRGKEDDFQYQDLIMREVDRLTPVNGTVFDGAGWALNRKPAYQYWFLREIAHVLEENGRFEPYRVDSANPPAALISDYGARVWLATHSDLRRYFMSHYLPYWRDLWLPGMSAVISPGSRATWTVPADGDYAVYASTSLAAHPWFRGNPTAFTRLGNGRPVRLKRGEPYTMASNDSRPIGVFIVPTNLKELFRQPPPGVDIDAAPPPRWHVPQLW